MKLYYFDMYGRAEPIRMLLHLAGEKYEDIRVDQDEGFDKLLKENKLEFGQVPVLELDDGTILSQSWAIMRYLGLKYKLIPTDPLE